MVQAQVILNSSQQFPAIVIKYVIMIIRSNNSAIMSIQRLTLRFRFSLHSKWIGSRTSRTSLTLASTSLPVEA